MKLKFTLIFVILNLCSLSAQDFPIQITTVIPPPYPQTWEESIGLGNNAFINLTNTDLTQSHEIKLAVKITSDNGITVEVLPEATPSQPIILAPGETRTVFGAELEALYLNYEESDIVYSGFDANELLDNPYLPEGTYTYCIKAYDYNSSAPLSNELTSGCAAPIYITTITAPIISYPYDEQEITAVIPQQVLFSWIPISYSSPNVRYAFQMVDYTDLSVNVYDLLNESDFQFYSEENIIGNTLLYGPEKPSLLLGHDYAVRVKSYLLDGALNIENAGFSDVVTFHYDGENNPFDPWVNIGDFNPSDDISFDPIGDFGNVGDFSGWGNTDFTDLLEIDEDNYETTPGTGDNVVDNTPPLISDDLGCGGGCNPVVITNTASVELTPNAMVNIGNFQLEVSTATGTTNGGYSGSGFIQSSSFFPYPVQVSFLNLKVNNSGQIIEGSATVDVRTGSWLDESWNDIEKNFSNVNFGQDPQQLIDNVNDPDFRLDQWNTLTQSAAITLPAGYGEGNYQVQITKMTFGPDQALFDAMVMIPLPDDDEGARKLVFTGTDICLSQSGPSIGSSPINLSLSESVKFSPSDHIALNIKSTGDATFGAGTFVQLDCNGFFSANIEGQVLFSPEMLKAEDANGNLNDTDTLTAAFSAEFQAWDAWSGAISFIDETNASDGKIKSTRFQYTGLEGYTFRLDYAKYDHAIDSNLPGMSFPLEYNGSRGDDWQGFMANNVEVMLPKWAKDDSNDERLSINSQALMIDGSGLTGQFDGFNLATLDQALLGGWDFSLTEMHLKIASNEFHQGDIKGQLKMPITEDPFAYTANIDHSQDNTQHNFVITTTGEIAMPAFLSDINLDPNSSISVDIDNNNDVEVEALLNGHIDLPESIGSIPGCNLENITFQGMAIRNHDELFEIESFGTENINTSITVATVAVGLSGLGMTKLNEVISGIEEYELGFDLDIQLGESNAGVSGAGSLFVVAKKLNLTPQDFDLNYDRAGMDAFQISGDLPGVGLQGMVEFFDNETLGHGFTGEFEANFIDAINIETRVMFGTNASGSSPKKFFLVEGMASLPTGMPIAGPVSAFGFGGGLYYRIKPSSNFEVEDLEGDGTATPLTSIYNNYTFDEDVLGIKAACVIGLTSPEVFNADVSLTVFIDVNDFSLENIIFEGDGYMMTEITDRSSPMMNIDAFLEYNFSSEVLHGEMAMDLKAPKPEEPLITANGTLKIHVGDYWYIKFGEPEHPVHGIVDLKILTTSLDSYFMTGQNLPAPILPDYVQEHFSDYTPSFAYGASVQGTGVAMGVHARVLSEVDLWVAYMNLDVGAGFDFTAMSYSNALCNGSTEFGINQWYATVRGYIYGDLAFTTLDYEWLSVNAGLLVDGALPNPTGFRGHAHFNVETFLKDFSVEEDFSIGDVCQMNPILNEDGEVVTVSSPIQGLSLIKNATPGSLESDVDLFAQPKIQFHIDPNEIMEFNYPDGNGNVINEDIIFDRQVLWKEKVDGDFIDIYHTEVWNEGSKTYTYTRVASDGTSLEIGRPNTEYWFRTVITPGKMVDGNFEVFTSEATGQDLLEVSSHKYTTGKNVTSINDAHVDFCRPYKRQRYVTPGDYYNALVRFNVSYIPAFEEYEANGYTFNAEIYKQGVPTPVVVDSIDYSQNLLALYDISSLAPEGIYKVVFSAQKTITAIGPDGYDDVFGDNTNNDVSSINTSASANASTYSDFQGGYYDNNNTYDSGPVTHEVVLERVDMFTYFFGTSKYNTMEDKLNSYSVVNNYVEIKPTNLTLDDLSSIEPPNAPIEFITYKSINMEFAGGEPFEEMDLFAPPLQVGDHERQGKLITFRFQPAYWYPSNPWIECDPLGINDLDLPVDYASENFDGGLPVEDPTLEKYQDFRFKSEFNTSGGLMDTSFDLEYIGVAPPLSDSEVIGNTTNGGSSQSNFGGFFNEGNSTINSGNLTLIWNGDLIAKQSFCQTCLLIPDKTYIHMASGLFKFKIRTHDVDMNNNTNYSTKTFNVNLQIP